MGAIVYLQHRVQSYVVERAQRDERGAAFVEYALLLVLIAVFCIIAVTFLGENAADRFSRVGHSVAAS